MQTTIGRACDATTDRKVGGDLNQRLNPPFYGSSRRKLGAFCSTPYSDGISKTGHPTPKLSPSTPITTTRKAQP
jgi:hypothetical protein